MLYVVGKKSVKRTFLYTNIYYLGGKNPQNKTKRIQKNYNKMWLRCPQNCLTQHTRKSLETATATGAVIEIEGHNRPGPSA